MSADRYTYAEATGYGWDVFLNGAWVGWSAGSLADAQDMVDRWRSEGVTPRA